MEATNQQISMRSECSCCSLPEASRGVMEVGRDTAVDCDRVSCTATACKSVLSEPNNAQGSRRPQWGQTEWAESQGMTSESALANV